jgi:hypothetical protein
MKNGTCFDVFQELDAIAKHLSSFRVGVFTRIIILNKMLMNLIGSCSTNHFLKIQPLLTSDRKKRKYIIR